jgi:DNA (cytosine-5)-methyltransferase 1
VIADTLRPKLARLRTGAPPRVLDLFAGCGGFSLGFHSAGFHLAGAVESDPDAARSYGQNFHPGSPEHARARDITRTSPAELALELRLGSLKDAIDVIIGGPPCQAFARVGRPKLREIEEHPEAYRRDPRAQLYRHYLRYVEAFQPLALMMENVPDVLNHAGQNVAQEICDVLGSMGYVCRYTLLNAAFYGVPQMRERMFLVGYRHEIATDIAFPAPTHWCQPPPGYSSTRAVALKHLRAADLFERPHSYTDTPPAHTGLPPAVTAKQALADLPLIDARAQLASRQLVRGARRFEQALPYPRRSAISQYASLMRSWPGFEADESVSDHVIRYLPRDYEIFSRMQPGDQYPQAHAIAMNMFEARLDIAARDRVVKPESKEYERLRAAIVPPYDVGKFPNKWRKMWADKPARTLMAHLGKDSYSHIHYDSAQARTISVREAARLQSFPDGFIFCGTMNPAFRQIGNAVPPLLARALARAMMTVLSKASRAGLLQANASRQRSPKSVAKGRARAALAERVT